MAVVQTPSWTVYLAVARIFRGRRLHSFSCLLSLEGTCRLENDIKSKVERRWNPKVDGNSYSLAECLMATRVEAVRRPTIYEECPLIHYARHTSA
eukprot:5930096-Pleurochrysis_carterae.AAC.1